MSCVCKAKADGSIQYCSLHFAAKDYLGRLIEAEERNRRLLWLVGEKDKMIASLRYDDNGVETPEIEAVLALTPADAPKEGE